MLDQLLQVWRDPHARHALLVHIPIALGILGLLPVLALAFTGFRNKTLKLAAAAMFLIASAGAFLAEEAGEEAAEGVKAVNPDLTQVERAAIHDHEELGESGWVWCLIPAGLLAVSLVNKKPIRIGAGILAIVGAGSVAVWVGLTGHAGGKLVYTYGLGVPKRGAGSVILPVPAAINSEHHDKD